MLIQEKITQAVGILREFDVDCWLTFARETGMNGDPILQFLVGGDLTWHSAIIITKSGETCAVVGEYDRKGIEDLGAYTRVISYVQGMKKPFLEYLRGLNPARIAINYSRDSETCDGLTHGMYLTLVDFLREIGYDDRLLQADNIISALRARKTPTELKRIIAAISATEKIFKGVASFIAPGKTEKEIADFMSREVERAGLQCAWEPSSCPAVFTGPDTAAAHYGPTGRKVEEGHILNMDFGLKVEGYCSDLQRTFYIRKKGESSVPTEVQRGFDTIVRSIEKARLAMRPGIAGHEVDSIARGIVTGAGYAEFPHGLGHQVGRFVHDGTALLGPKWEKYANKPFITLEEGMVFTLEPRLTVAGRGIATIEEMVVVKNEGAEFLSTPQQKLLLV